MTMDFADALQLKREISISLLVRANAVRTISFAAATRAVAVRAESELRPLVNGVGIGETKTGENYIKLLTREPSPLKPADLAQHYGVKEKNLVIETVGPIRFKNATDRHRPPFPGISIGHFNITAGTLGCFVQDENNKTFILSNNHVLADTDRGKWKDAVLQPGPLDLGRKRKDTIARLSHLVPLSRSGDNEMDAAIALLESSIQADSRIFKMQKVQSVGRPKNKLKVEKWGRTTGHTTGSITTRSLDVQIDFDSETLSFVDQFEVKGSRGTMFCDGGDSGSLILERDTFKAIGLLFAGNAEGTTYATPIQEVLDAFSVRIL